MDHEFSYCYTELIKRDRKAERHYYTRLPEQIDFNNNKAIIISISGNGATNLKSANGFAKIVQTNLDLMFKNKDGKDALDFVDIFSVKYATRTKNYGTGYITTDFANKLTDTLVKFLTDKNGKPLPLDQAQRNFSRITFFTYCQGNFSLNDIIDMLNEKLVELGYTNEEVIAINNASMEISFAAPNSAENKIPSVRILSANDPVVGEDINYLLEHDEKLKNLDGIALHQDQPGHLYGKERFGATAPCLQVISNNFLNALHGFHLVYTDHNIKCVSFNKKWELNPCIIDHENLVSPNAKCAAESIALATCFAVQHSFNNMCAETYQSQDWNQLIDDLQFNIDSYKPKKLTKLNADFAPGFRMNDGLAITNEEAALKTNIDAAPLAHNNENIKD